MGRARGGLAGMGAAGGALRRGWYLPIRLLVLVMDQDTATRLFADFLARKQMELGEALVGNPPSPKRLSSGWAFFYQSRAYVETGETADMLVGQGPVVITDIGHLIEGGSLDRDLEALLSRSKGAP